MPLPDFPNCEEIQRRIVQELGGVDLDAWVWEYRGREQVSVGTPEGGDVEVRLKGNMVGLTTLVPQRYSFCLTPQENWRRLGCKGADCYRPTSALQFEWLPKCGEGETPIGVAQALGSGREPLEGIEEAPEPEGLSGPELQKAATRITKAEKVIRYITGTAGVGKHPRFYCEASPRRLLPDKRKTVELTGGVQVSFPEHLFGVHDEEWTAVWRCLWMDIDSPRNREVDELVRAAEAIREARRALRNPPEEATEEDMVRLAREGLQRQREAVDILRRLMEGENPPIKRCDFSYNARFTADEVLEQARRQLGLRGEER